MGKNKMQKQLLDKTPNTSHLYENYEVQEVIQAYTKDLELSSLNSELGTGARLKEVGGNTLLLTPRDINKEENTSAGHDFANNATRELYNDQTFQMEFHILDNLTPRFEEFLHLTQTEALQNSGKKVDFVVPIVNDEGNHWYGAIITYNPNAVSENKYSYTFLDSLKNEAGHCPDNIKLKIESTFGADIAENKETKGFYKQPSGSLSCGACLSANLMMNTNVIPGEHKKDVDIDLRKEHFRMVPKMGWRNQPLTEAIADSLYLLKSSNAKEELLNAAQNGTRKQFLETCSKWETKLPNQKGIVIEFKSNVNKLCFDSRYNRIGIIDERKLNERLDQLKENEKQIERVENIAKKFVTCINSADMNGAQNVLTNTTLSDLKKIQQSSYYKENVNLESPEGRSVDGIVNSYILDKTKSSKNSKKSIDQSINSFNEIHASVLNSLELGSRPKQDKRIEDSARKFVMHINAADMNGAQQFLESISANDLSKIQQSKYYNDNVNLESPEGKAVNNIVTCYVKDKVKSTPETEESLDKSIRNLMKTVAKKLNIIIKSSSSKNRNSTQNRYNSATKEKLQR